MKLSTNILTPLLWAFAMPLTALTVFAQEDPNVVPEWPYEPYCKPCEESCNTCGDGEASGSLNQNDGNETGVEPCQDEDEADGTGGTSSTDADGPVNPKVNLGTSEGANEEKPIRGSKVRHRGAKLGSAGDYKRSSLKINVGHGSEVIRQASSGTGSATTTGDMKQVVSDKFLIDMTNIDNSDTAKGYQMVVYQYGTLPSKGTNGFYPVTGLTKLRTITFKNPDTTLNGKMEVYHDEETVTGKEDRKLEYQKTTSGGVEFWTLTESVKNNSTWYVYRKDEIRRAYSGSDYKQLRRRQEADSAGTLATVSKVWESWEIFTVNGSDRTRLVERRVYATDNPSSSLPSGVSTAPTGAIRKTVMTYNDDVSDPQSHGRAATRTEYTFNSSGTAVETQSITYTYSGTTSYDYRAITQNRAGLTEVVKDWTYIPPAGIDRHRYPAQPAYRERTLNGTRVEYEARSVSASNGEIVVTDTRYGGAGSTEVTKRYYHDGSSTSKVEHWRLKAVEHDDDTWTLYSHSTLTGGGRQEITQSGVGSKTSISDGTKITRKYNRENYQILEITEDIASGEETGRWEVTEEADDGRPEKTVYNNNTNDYEELTYTCCGLQTRRQRSGLTINYERDKYGRVDYEVTDYATKVSIKTKLTAKTGSTGGGMTTQRVQHEGGSNATSPTEFLIGETTVDAAGRVVERKRPDADGDGTDETTTVAYAVLTGGKLKTTVTRSVDSGATDAVEETTRWGSGEVYERRGNAVADVRYEHGITSSSYRTTFKTIRLKQNSSGTEVTTEWEKVTSDPSGRTIKREIAPGGSSCTETYTYYTSNTTSSARKGRLYRMTDMDGVVTEHLYDARGRRYRSGTPYDGSGFDYSVDRVSEVRWDVVDDTTSGLGIAAYRTRNYVYKPSSSTAVLVSTTYEAVDGDDAKTVRFGRTTTWTRAEGTTYGDGIWSETTTNVDSTKEVRNYSDWRLANVEIKNSAGTVVSKVTYAYGGLGWVSSITDLRNSSVTSYTYEESGAVETVTVERGTGTTDDLVTTYDRDRLGRVDRIQFPEGGYQYFRYNPAGQVLKKWGAHTYPVRYVFDEQGRMIEMHTYRSITNNTEPPTTAGDKTTWVYDGATGRLTSKTDAQSKTVSYTYTKAGRLYTRTWARTVSSNALVTTYLYALGSGKTGDDTGVSDITGDLTKVDYSDSTPDVTYTWDRLVRLATVSDAFGSRTFHYNDTTDLSLDYEELDGLVDIDLERNYDTNGRNAGYTIDNVADISRTYEAAGRFAKVKDVSPALDIATYAYASNAYALIASVTLNGTSFTATNTWESYRAVLTEKKNKIGTTIISEYDYIVNKDGQRTKATMSGAVFTGTPWWGLVYNATGEIESAKHSATTGYNRAYDQDGLGNWDKSSEGATDPVNNPFTTGVVTDYTADSLNQYDSIKVGSAAAVSPVHDEDGNLTDDASTYTFEWNAANQLLKVRNRSTTALIATYTYDYLGRRVRKVTSSLDIVYVYDGWNLIAEYDNSGSDPALDRTYVWGLDLSVSIHGAGGVGGLLRVTDHTVSPIKHYYPFYDGNGNVSEYILNGATSAAIHFEYDAFGNVLNGPTGQDDPEFAIQFSTKLVDEEAGLSYYGYRYYDPETGRWLSRDPLGERGGLNLYGFVNNNAVNRWDYLGLKDFLIGFYGAGSHGAYGNLWFKKTYVDAGGTGYLFSDGKDDKAIKKLFAEIDTNKDKKIVSSEISKHTYKAVGYSWGGPTTTYFTRRLFLPKGKKKKEVEGYELCATVPFKAIVTIDPVTLLKVMRAPKSNVKRWVNYYQKRKNSLMDLYLHGKRVRQKKFGTFASRKFRGTSWPKADRNINVPVDWAKKTKKQLYLPGRQEVGVMRGAQVNHDTITWFVYSDAVSELSSKNK